MGKKPLHRDVQGVDFVHLLERPHPFLPVPAHQTPLVAGLAQRHYGVLAVLLDMVGVTRPRLIADRAGQLLDHLDVLPLSLGQAVVHRVARSMFRLLASCDLQTSIRA